MITLYGGPLGWGETFAQLKWRLLNHGSYVDTGHWQGQKDVPHTRTLELQHVGIDVPIMLSVQEWADYMSDGLNLPWAEDHFQERVGGQPLNPGEEYKNWPWYKSGVEDHKGTGQFSHTYMERFWARQAGSPPTDNRGGWLEPGQNHGIRFRYGDLMDLIKLLDDEPTTRQAYLPIWFPEDLAATREGQRVPCSLGYHLMLRDKKLHVFYPMRSVDLFRYLTDDIYMAGRLVQWVINQMNERNQRDISDKEVLPWDDVIPGTVQFFASSVHIFEAEESRLQREVGTNTVRGVS